MTQQKKNDIFKDNAFEIERSLQHKDPDSGRLVPSTGLADLFLWISATDEGPEINAQVKGHALERAEKPGTYYVKVSGASVTGAVFPTVDGTLFYLVGGNLAGDIIGSSPRRAWNVRKV
jgi:hypothetical protein